MYEVNKKNALSLYHFYKMKNPNIEFNDFIKELFYDDLISSKTFVEEIEGRVVSYIQFAKTVNNKGKIRLFYFDKGYEEQGKELLFRATSYFYMLHIFDIEIFNEKDKILNVSFGNVLYSHMEEVVHNFLSIKYNNLKIDELENVFSY